MKRKGIAAERELLHLLWQRGFACCRVAGSGSIPEPSCDLLAGNGKSKYAIECKTSRQKKKYLDKKQMNDFVKFAEGFGLKPLLAIRFAYQDWHFIEPEKLEKTKKGFAISLQNIEKIGKKIEEI